MNSTTPEASTNSSATDNSFWPMTSADLWSYKINLAFGLPVHSYIIWLIVTGTDSAIASEFFNLNLSVSELCFSLNCLLALLLHFLSLFYSLGALVKFLIGIPITGRSLFQCLMCVERYLAVVHPVTFLKYKPLRYRLICCVMVWITTLGSCLGCMFTMTLNNGNGFMWLFSIQFLLYVSIMLFCCVAVLRVLKQSGPGERKEKVEENHMKRRAFILILIITISMIVIFVPFIFVGFSGIFMQMNVDQHRSLGFVSFILGGFVHPVLFLHRNGKLSRVCIS